MRTEEGTHLVLGDKHVADEMVPRVSTLIARGALLQDRRLQVSESGEVRWVTRSSPPASLRGATPLDRLRSPIAPAGVAGPDGPTISHGVRAPAVRPGLASFRAPWGRWRSL